MSISQLFPPMKTPAMLSNLLPNAARRARRRGLLELADSGALEVTRGGGGSGQRRGGLGTLSVWLGNLFNKGTDL